MTFTHKAVNGIRNQIGKWLAQDRHLIGAQGIYLYLLPPYHQIYLTFFFFANIKKNCVVEIITAGKPVDKNHSKSIYVVGSMLTPRVTIVKEKQGLWLRGS